MNCVCILHCLSFELSALYHAGCPSTSLYYLTALPFSGISSLLIIKSPGDLDFDLFLLNEFSLFAMLSFLNLFYLIPSASLCFNSSMSIFLAVECWIICDSVVCSDSISYLFTSNLFRSSYIPLFWRTKLSLSFLSF